MLLRCPVCRADLTKNTNTFCCKNKHSFDIAKEGYTNLLCGHKSGDLTGDNKLMARARSALLSKGYYISLANGILSLLQELQPASVLDICCGEGWYTDFISSHIDADVYGFDLSKEMIKLAAKRGGNANYFVANLSSIPVKDSAFDAAMHLFAPTNAAEFRRVIKKGGSLLSVMPAANHLYEMKKILYDKPYLNDETTPVIAGFSNIASVKVSDTVTLECAEDIKALFEMTPYMYRTPREGVQRLLQLDTLKTQIEFIINIYQ